MICLAAGARIAFVVQRWKSERTKIHRFSKFSIDFKICSLAYGFFTVNHKDLAKVPDFWFADFFLEKFKIHRPVSNFPWIFCCYESVSSM
jgi:hypothetical protein